MAGFTDIDGSDVGPGGREASVKTSEMEFTELGKTLPGAHWGGLKSHGSVLDVGHLRRPRVKILGEMLERLRRSSSFRNKSSRQGIGGVLTGDRATSPGGTCPIGITWLSPSQPRWVWRMPYADWQDWVLCPIRKTEREDLAHPNHKPRDLGTGGFPKKTQGAPSRRGLVC